MRGEWKPGDLLPGETDLIEAYAVSRITVRQVFDLLVNEGLVYRQRGRGTFVAQPAIEQTQVPIVSFTDEMRRRGLAPGTRVLEANLLPAPADIAERLRVAPGTELAHIQRLRMAGGEPMAIEDAYLVHSHCPGVLEHDYASTSLRRTLGEVYGIRWLRARQTIRAVGASQSVAHLLSVRPGAALLFIERVSISEEGMTLEFLRIHYRGDRYTLYSELQG